MDALKRKIMPRRYSMKDGDGEFSFPCYLPSRSLAPLFYSSRLSLASSLLPPTFKILLFLVSTLLYIYSTGKPNIRGTPQNLHIISPSRLRQLRRSRRGDAETSREGIRRRGEERVGAGETGEFPEQVDSAWEQEDGGGVCEE